MRGDWGVHPVLLPRAFSLVECGEFGSIIVKPIGEGTELLAGMEVGDALTVFGPLGKGYDLDNQGRRPIPVAGGVGVAPLLYLAREFHAAGTRGVFVYGGRTEDDLPLAEDIAEVADLMVTTEKAGHGAKRDG